MSAEDRAIDSTINWIRRSLDWAVEDDVDDAHEFLDSLRVDLCLSTRSSCSRQRARC